MGYESRIYVVRKSSARPIDGEKRWAEKIAMIDMCKCYPMSDLFRRKPKTDCYIYADDGNTRIDEDCYGEQLTEASLSESIQIVKKVIEKDPYEYWRYKVLLSTLQSIYECVGNDEQFAVLHYGY